MGSFFSRLCNLGSSSGSRRSRQTGAAVPSSPSGHADAPIELVQGEAGPTPSRARAPLEGGPPSARSPLRSQSNSARRPIASRTPSGMTLRAPPSVAVSEHASAVTPESGEASTAATDSRYLQVPQRAGGSGTGTVSRTTRNPTPAISRRSSFNREELTNALMLALEGSLSARGPKGKRARREPPSTHESATPVPAELRAQHPACIAWNARHVMVMGPDGRLRRFPIDEGAPTGTAPASRRTPPVPAIGRRFTSQLDAIYDAHQDEIWDLEAEFSYDGDTKAIAFEVDGQPVPALPSDKLAAYLLSDGRVHAVQPELRECTSAAEFSLEAHGRSPEEVAELLKRYRPTGDRREVSDICESLQAKGRQVVHLEGGGKTAPQSLQVLKDAIAEHGPCMLVMNGHVRLLDRIDSYDERMVLSIRDPFTGSVMSVRDHEAFWQKADAWRNQCRPSDPNAGRDWDAIFLRSEGQGSGARGSRSSVGKSAI